MLANKALQAITNTGTGTFQLNSTGTGSWKSWRSQKATGAQVFYYAENADGTVWEFGYGTLTHATPDTITRNYLLSSTGALIDWVTADGTVYVMSVPFAQAMEGRYDATGGLFVPASRKSYTAVGAANKTVSANTWADAGGRFSLDNSAAARSVTLPAISAVSVGFNVEVFGLSQANVINIVPNGSDVIDYGTGGQTLPLPGKVPITIWSDGSQWRTDFDYSADHVLVIASPSAASAIDFPGLPYWVNHLRAEIEVTFSSDGADLLLQTYGADGVIDTGGSDYGVIVDAVNATPTAVPSAGSASSIGLFAGGADNGSSVGARSVVRGINIRRATYTKFDFASSWPNASNLSISAFGHGQRNEADLITGFKLTPSGGNVTGTVSLVVRS